jgi:threonine dehydrogenase-like Zn-dependent dehydrogenase
VRQIWLSTSRIHRTFERGPSVARMRSVRLDFADPSFPVSVVEVDDPPLPGPDWARVQVLAGGICGTDLHTLHPDGSGSPVFLPLIAFPMELGHELGGVVVEAGPDCPVEVGARVAVDPTLACEARGLDPCPACRAGWTTACRDMNVGAPRGFGHGFAVGVGGGWSDSVIVHRTQLQPAPDGVDDAGLALAEPLAIALAGLARRLPVAGAPVLVLGAGTIGLAAVAGLRALAPDSDVTVVAKHAHQQAAALALGATRVVEPGDDLLPKLAELTGGRVTGERSAEMVFGGFPHVVEAVGSGATLDTALKVVRQGGVVSLLGAINRTKADLAPLWFKNVDVVGSFGYGPGGVTFTRALDLIAAGGYPSEVIVTHTFARDDVREAVATANARDRGAIKVQLA